MRKLVMGCAIAACVALTAKSEARPPDTFGTPTRVAPAPPKKVATVGVASWYGEDFDGNPTASGETFDMNALTAASPDLPLGTKVEVTNLRNNRSLIVRVNDRGPFITGRFLDLSRAAAERLGFLNAGLAQVQIRVLDRANRFEAKRPRASSQNAPMNMN